MRKAAFVVQPGIYNLGRGNPFGFKLGRRKNVEPPIDLTRPIIKGPGKSFSTERTITVEINDKYWNIPTIIGGKQVSSREAIDYAKKTGKHVGIFDTEREALKAAVERSKRIGRLRKNLSK